jgi:hypothetical protein
VLFTYLPKTEAWLMVGVYIPYILIAISGYILFTRIKGRK